jgi:hypothetical protein
VTYSFDRDVVFKATDSSGNVLKSWTETVSFNNDTTEKIASGSFVLTDVPNGVASLSAKTDWHLRKKLAVTIAETVSTVGDVDATIVRTDGTDSVTFDITINDSGPHYGTGLAIGTATSLPEPAFQVYFADFSDNLWHYQEYGTGWNGADTTTLPAGFSASGDATGPNFQISVPHSALGTDYTWAIQVRTNLLGRYPESWNPWSGDASTYASPNNSQLSASFTGANKLPGGDLNNSNTVNILDYSMLKEHWVTTDPEADINGDSGVSLLDYSLMKDNWFTEGDPE